MLSKWKILNPKHRGLCPRPRKPRKGLTLNKFKYLNAKFRTNLLLSIYPGPKTPRDAGVTNEVIRRFCREKGTKKILGVCLGHQCIGYVFGARIRNAREIRHGKVSLVTHNGENVLKELKNPLSVVRYHSLVIDDGSGSVGESFPDCLEVTARSLDDNEIMAIRHKNMDVYGVQFHPESILTEDGLKLIQNFVDM